MKYCSTLSTLIIGLLVASTSFGQTANVSTLFGTGADTYIENGEAAQGSNVRVRLRNRPTTDRIIYTRFDLGAANISPDLINGATFSFTAQDDFNAATYDLYGLADGDANEAWDEGTLSFATAFGSPVDGGVGGSSLGAPFTLLGSGAVPAAAAAGDPISLTVTDTSNLLSFLQSDTDGVVTFGFVASSDGGNTADLHSKENVSGAAVPTLSLSLNATAGQSFTTADGAGGDTYVDSGDANETKGTTEANRVRVRSTPDIRKTYLRFDVPAFSEDGVADASLLLSADVTNDINPNTLELYGILDGAQGDGAGDWDEDTLTWNLSLTEAQNDGSGTGVGSDTVLLDTLTLPANPQGDPTRFNFEEGDIFAFTSEELQDFIEDDTNGLLSFLLIYSDPSGSSLGLATHELAAVNGNVIAPTLQITAVPEPGAGLIWTLLGLVGLLTWRRRGARE